MLMIYHYLKFHRFPSNGSLVISIKPKPTEIFVLPYCYHIVISHSKMTLLQQKLTTCPSPFITSFQDPNMCSTSVKTMQQVCASTMLLLLLVRIKKQSSEVAFNGIKIKQSFIKITEFIQVKLQEHTQTHSYLIRTQMFKVHSLSLNIFKQLFLLYRRAGNTSCL